ncbi:putative extracellular solute-binding protein [Bifidobacterium actinocoloniiforme DSM 22766]|uniref:Putative extracellular solute-binding protein n=1 Tax=Bifidobacterium actinocoloniiforme DSM 22766 TaxID=1437605 RepID=A0A086Z2P8_9BIFI|nr:extracellular solute-binding protein [Bifidobacterium actinocoloniiforme]AKV55766.1 ABC transporter substrate-binding protein [Bifidobacterium actinocoloniiforme DSM 22766]KFI40798.1 putative extracellular solute-binding protein [Bifidobacterium actinocoloniiforme DSM 22766]
MKKSMRIASACVACLALLSFSACGAPGSQGSKDAGGADQVHSDAKANDDAKCQNTIKKKGVEKVTVWAWYPAMEKMVDTFNDQHDDVQVCWTRAGSGQTQYQKITTAVKAKSGLADVVQIEYDVLSQYVSGVEKHLVDLNQFGADKLSDKYTKGVWNAVSLRGGKSVYAIPVDQGPYVMMYRKDIFDKYGVKVPTTWQEYEQAGKELRQKGFQGHIGNYEPSGNGSNVTLIAQNKGKVYDYSASQPDKLGVDFTSKESKEVMEYWQRLAKEGVVTTDDAYTAEWYKKIVDGSWATAVCASWLVGNLRGVSGADSSADWKVAKAPGWSSTTPSVNFGGSSLAVTDQAKVTKKAAKVAMEFFDDPAIQQTAITESGLFPTWTKVLNSESFQNMTDPFYGDQKINQVIAPVALGYKGYDFLPFQPYAYDEQTKVFTEIVRNGADVPSSLRALNKTLTDYATQQGFTVKK